MPDGKHFGYKRYNLEELYVIFNGVRTNPTEKTLGGDPKCRPSNCLFLVD